MTDGHISDEQGFRQFVERDAPDALADVIDQIRNEWDGSPLFVMAIPEHEQLDALILPAEAAAERLNQMLDAVRELAEVPVAAALAFSSPLVTPAGITPAEGLLSIVCADADGRQATIFKRLHQDETGRAAVDDLPPDVEPQIMSGVTMEFMGSVLGLCGKVRSGEVERDTELWDALLEDALRSLRSPRAPG